MVQSKDPNNNAMDGFVSFFGCEDESENCCRSSLMLKESNSLPPEDNLGNVEYKRGLVNPCQDRIEHLISQMKWRLGEGNGVALYELGVEDNGTLSGLSHADLQSSFKTIRSMVCRLGAQMEIIKIREVGSDGFTRLAAEVMVHTNKVLESIGECRFSLIGPADSGKSSLIGTLCSGVNDDGNGQSRLTLFRHLHEVMTGRTSSLTEQYMGINRLSKSLLGYNHCRTPMEILVRSKCLVALIDLAGHRKYQRTTLFGLTSRHPHFALVLVSKCRGLVSSVVDYMNYLQFLQIRPILIATKTDICSNVKEIPESCDVFTDLRSAKLLRPLAPMICLDSSLKMEDVACQIMENRITPILQISNVDGSGLDMLGSLITHLTMWQQTICDVPKSNVEFQVYSFDKSNLVIRGLLCSGKIQTNSILAFGPLMDNTFANVKICSIRRLNVPIKCLMQGQTGSIAISSDHIRIPKRKGLVLLSEIPSTDNVTRSFRARVHQIHTINQCHKLRPGCLLTLHMGNVCQTVSVAAYDPHRNTISVTLYKQSEYLQLGRSFILRNSGIRLMGTVTGIG